MFDADRRLMRSLHGTIRRSFGAGVIALVVAVAGCSDSPDADIEESQVSRDAPSTVRQSELTLSYLVEAQRLVSSDIETADHFGGTVAVDGDVAVVGAIGESTGGADAGAAYILERSGTGPWAEVQKLQASDAQAGDEFGSSVAVSGNVVVVGAFKEDTGGDRAGSAYVFERDSSGTWSQVQKLQASDRQIVGRFGSSVAIDNDIAMIAARSTDAGAYQAGAIYVFERDQAGVWNEVQKLQASDPAVQALLGWSLALDGDVAVSGTVGRAPGRVISAGSIYIFERGTNGQWSEVQKLFASDYAQGDYFGNSVSVSGNLLLVGAYMEDTGGTDAGAAYLFERGTNGQWSEIQKLKARDVRGNTQFGSSVAIDAGVAFVGARLHGTGPYYAGAAYVFEQDAQGTWRQTQNLKGSNLQGSDHFGASVSLNGDVAIVGAPEKDVNGYWDGTVYIFDMLPNQAPVATNDTFSAVEETAITLDVLTNDSDADAEPIGVINATASSHGTVTVNSDDTIDYTPEADFDGTDSFEYTIADSRGGTDWATVTVHVAGVNDLPQAIVDTASTNKNRDVVMDVLANDTDIDGDPLAVGSITQPSNGTVTNNGTDVTYSPNTNFSGLDSFSYTVFDGNGGTDTATVEINVHFVNYAPEATDDAAATPEDMAVTLDPLANDTDPENDTLSIESVTQPSHGSVSQSATRLIYTPDADFHGTDSFTYQASDGVSTDSAWVAVTVQPQNDAPEAVHDAATTDEDNSVTIDVLRNDTDVDGDLLNVESVGAAQHGDAATDGTSVSYTPNADFYGTDTFSYTLTDAAGESASGSVMVTIEPVNDSPVAVDDTASTDEDTAVMVNVLQNDSDPDGDSLTLASVTTPEIGEATIEDGSIRYISKTNFFGEVQFDYEMADEAGESATATLTVTVNEANVPPSFVELTPAEAEQVRVEVGAKVEFEFAAEDTDGDELHFGIDPLPGGASFSEQSGSFSWTTAAGDEGEHVLALTVSDGRLADERTVVLVVETPSSGDSGGGAGGDADAGSPDSTNETRREAEGCAAAPVGAPAPASVVVAFCVLLGVIRRRRSPPSNAL